MVTACVGFDAGCQGDAMMRGHSLGVPRFGVRHCHWRDVFCQAPLHIENLGRSLLQMNVANKAWQVDDRHQLDPGPAAANNDRIDFTRKLRPSQPTGILQ